MTDLQKVLTAIVDSLPIREEGAHDELREQIASLKAPTAPKAAPAAPKAKK